MAISEDFLKKSPVLSENLQLFSSNPTQSLDFQLRSVRASLSDRDKKLLLYREDNCVNPVRMYRLSNGDYQCSFEQPNGQKGLTYQIRRDWRELILTEDETNDCGEMLFHRTGALFSLAVLKYEACVFHGVVMDDHGRGILVMAAAGIGKTTHTNLWESQGYAQIINGDRCLCRRLDGIWYAYGMPWAGSSGKIRNQEVPVHTIVMLERGRVNRVERMTAFASQLALLQRIFAPVSRGQLQEQAFQYVQDIAEKIPVLRLWCRPDVASVEVLRDAVRRLT